VKRPKHFKILFTKCHERCFLF